MNRFFSNYMLLIVVFITGAAVLVIEVAATRILSVYFGNTIFTVSSVISVILLALSLGYFIGGRLADKRATEILFFQIIAVSGVSVLLLQMLNVVLLPVVSAGLDLQSGPIIASIMLFLLPGFLLGTLSPLVVKLQKMRLESQGVGQVAGDVFFWSTLGSIVGSLATGFVLIPNFGISQIIVGTGIVLLFIGIVGMSFSQKIPISKMRGLLLLLLLPVLHVGLIAAGDAETKGIRVFAADGLYDNIHIYDEEVNGIRIRFLQQSTDASSAMFLDSPELVYEYTKYYEVYKLAKPDIKRALVIGGGAYSVPKALLRTDSDVVVDVAEIEPEMFDLAKKYFNVPTTDRLVNHVEDGRRFLANSDTKYDVIFLDAFHSSIPQHLTTKEFFTMVKSKLTADGVVIMNTIGTLEQKKPSYEMSQIKTFSSVFSNYHVFGAYSPTALFAQNILLAGYNTDKMIAVSSAQNDNEFMAKLPKQLINTDQLDLSAYPLFTDDYAPVDYLTSYDLKEINRL